MFDLYIRNEYLVASVQLTLAMLGMGATLAPKDFADILRFPKGIVLGNVMQILLVPMVAWLFVQLFDLEPGLIIGIALCAAIPGGTTSNIFTYLAGGNVALSVSMTATATLACLATTPIILSVLAAGYMPANFSMPTADIALDVVLFVLLPLVLGMAYGRLYPASAEMFSKWCIRGSIAVIAIIVIGSAGAGRLDMDAYGLANAQFLLLYIVILIALSLWIPKSIGLVARDVTAVNMEVTFRNTNLALLIKVSLFPAVAGVSDPIGDGVLFTVLLYGGYQLILSVLMIYMGRLRHRNENNDLPSQSSG